MTSQRDDEILSALGSLIGDDDEASVSELRTEVQTLRDEVSRLRNLVEDHAYMLVLSGVAQADGTPDQRALVVRLTLFHRARLSDDGRAEAHWREINDMLADDYYKAQIYDVMVRAGTGESNHQTGSSTLQPVPGITLERADDREDSRTTLVCDIADVPDRETIIESGDSTSE